MNSADTSELLKSQEIAWTGLLIIMEAAADLATTASIKTTFAQESQQYLELLRGLIADLDNGLYDIDQLVQPSRKTEEIIHLNRLLQESATKADFYKPNSPLVKLSCRLEQVMGQLGDRQFVPIIDPITQDLLQQMLTVMGQLIDEYCQEDAESIDKLHGDWEEQIYQILNNLDHAPVSQLDRSYGNEDLLSSSYPAIGEDKGLDNDPFGIDADSEALHLFDLDLDLAANFSLAKDLDAVLNSDLELEINPNLDLVTLSSSSPLEEFAVGNKQEEIKIVEVPETTFTTTEATLPMPELLVDIFQQPEQRKTLGNDDETELQGTVWKDHQEDLTTVAEIINDWQKSYLMEPTQLESFKPVSTKTVSNALSPRAISLENHAKTREGEAITAQNFFDASDGESMTATDSTEDEDDYLLWSNSIAEANEQFEEIDELVQFEPVEQVETLESIESVAPIEQFFPQEFNTLDIDTELEESPIYQSHQYSYNLTNSTNSTVANPSDRSLPKVEFTEIDKNSTNPSIETPTYQVEALQSQDHQTTHQLELEQIAENYCYSSEVNQDSTIKIQLTQMESLSNLSEEIALRNSNLDVYLQEMRSLYDTAQANLHIMTTSDEPASADLQQSAIAGLHNNFEQIVGLINHTERQTKDMVRDIYHLRRSFQQVLRHPISGLVGKFPRILRERSLQHGKQVELIVQGADISIERSLLKVVATVLDILLINALEYGIETPEERRLQGKSPQGKIEVIVAQIDTQTTITIRDDGYGMPISDLSGASKAKLQAHQLKLQEVGASLTMQSQLNQGSEFILTLPNSSSVTEVIVVSINQISMAVNANLIVEVIPIDQHSNLLSSQLPWKDQVLPLINLDTFFQLNCRSTSLDPKDIIVEREQLPAFLIIDYQNHRFALKTDGCTHKQGGIFQQVAGDILLPQTFNGTVILGDGRAVPLLNPFELVNRCLRAPDFADPSTTTEEIHSHNSLHNISSLSDFFDLGDSRPEPENLESSGLFVNGTEVSQPSSQQQKKQKLAPPKVLIVESSANVRRYLSMALGKFGFDTEQVKNAREAIAFLAPVDKNISTKASPKASVDAMISDLDMGNIDHFQFISQIRANYSEQALPIIILTSHSSDRDRQTALERGANAYFSKPYREEELIATLRKLVSS